MRRNATRIIFGVIVILLGIGFLGYQLDWWAFNPFAGWWTLFLIVPAIGSMIAYRPSTGNVLVLLLGIWLLIRQQHFIPSHIMNAATVTVLLILLGIWLIVSAFRKKQPVPISDGNPYVFQGEGNGAPPYGQNPGNVPPRHNPNARMDASDCPEYFAIFSGNEIVNTSRALRGGSATALFGGVELDLSTAVLAGNISFSANAIFGGVDVIVPAGIRIEITGFSLFGGCDNHSVFSTDSSMPCLTIRHFSLFGGVDIR